MYLTDIRGFTAESNIALSPARLRGFSMQEPSCIFLCDGGTLFRGQKYDSPPEMQIPLCRITIHGMGILGDKGLTVHFARFCRLYNIAPRYLSLSDMGIAFFVAENEREKVLDALCAYFPMWA